MAAAQIVIIGAANIDIFAQADQMLKKHDSNPGKVHIAQGGVGRNIAENLARLHLEPVFLTALAQDHDGRLIKQRLEHLGAKVHAVLQAQSNRYVAMLDAKGDMMTAVSDMANLDVLDDGFFVKHIATLSQADCLVLDANLSEKTWSWITSHVPRPIYADAISVAKASRLKPYLAHIDGLKVNQFEAAALSGEPKAASPEVHVHALLEQGVKNVFLTLGAAGALHGCVDGICHKPILRAKKDIVNTTGAGDAFMSGVIYARRHHKDALIYGLAMSSIALKSRDAVSEYLTPKLLEITVKERVISCNSQSTPKFKMR